MFCILRSYRYLLITIKTAQTFVFFKQFLKSMGLLLILTLKPQIVFDLYYFDHPVENVAKTSIIFQSILPPLLLQLLTYFIDVIGFKMMLQVMLWLDFNLWGKIPPTVHKRCNNALKNAESRRVKSISKSCRIIMNEDVVNTIAAR